MSAVVCALDPDAPRHRGLPADHSRRFEAGALLPRGARLRGRAHEEHVSRGADGAQLCTAPAVAFRLSSALNGSSYRCSNDPDEAIRRMLPRRTSFSSILPSVTSDAARAWERARDCGARLISRGGPVTLPPSAGEITAVKFRDPEGHPLELIEFPNGSSAVWSGEGMLGIDHSAIGVADVDVD